MIHPSGGSLRIIGALRIAVPLLVSLLLPGCGGPKSMSSDSPQLAQLEITPRTSSIALGETLQFKATGRFTDGSSKDETKLAVWTSSNGNVASIDPSGFAKSLSSGSVTMSARVKGLHSSAALTVSQAAIVSIVVDPSARSIALGTATQLKAMATYTDRSTHDLTNIVSWTSSEPNVVAVNSTGLAVSRSTGKASITATSGPTNASCELTVLQAALVAISVDQNRPAVPLGATSQLNALGAYTDGQTRDLTNSVSWSSSPRGVVGINVSGLATGLKVGAATIHASSGSITGTGTLTVSPPALTAIKISPVNPTIPLASSVQLTTMGSFTDGSTQDLTKSVTWGVDDASILSINSTGNVTGQRVGSVGVSAAFGGIQGSTTIVVQPIVATSYFNTGPDGLDSTIRMTNPGGDEQKLCAMVYVFDQDQQMAECCGCGISQNGLRTLSLNRDLIGNPLTGARPVTGSVMLTTADSVSNPSCNPASITPAGMGRAWATHLQSTTPSAGAFTEEPLSQSPLPATLASALQTQCSFIQQLGGGRGICSCGTGH